MLLAWTGIAAAQESAAPVKHYYNRTAFKIPIVIDDQERAGLKELKLYVRRLPGEWECVATAPAGQKAFAYQAQQDGEYWFNIATVDKAGHAVPDDVGKHDPALIVVVDTLPPQIDVRPLTASNGQTYLQCKMQDANPDYATVKMQYQLADGSWRPLVPVAATAGVVQVPDPSVLEGKVRVHAADKAGNVAEREIDLNQNKVASAPLPLRPAAANSAGPEDMPSYAAETPKSPPAVTIPPVGKGDSGASTGGVDPYVPPLPPPAAASASEKRPLPVSSLPDGGDGPMPPTARAPLAEPPTRSGDTLAETPRSDVATVPIINTMRARFDFTLDATPGGVAQVDVYASADNGKSWKIIGTSKDGRSPAVVEFPGEGRFSYAFVVKPVNGLTSSLPKSGEQPDGWIDIDTTRPTAELLTVAPGTGSEAGSLLISWTAKDANLGAEPVTLLYASQPGGPWHPIAAKTANSGSFRWPLPKEVGSRLWVRMEVRDRAGNVTGCETPQSIALEGPRAKVRILNVGPAQN